MGATNSTQSEVILKTSKGSLRGLQLSDAQTGEPAYRRYTRIPYALPPLGPLRWQKPQALPEDFSFNVEHDEPGDYTSFGPICPQPVYDLVSGRIKNPDAGPEQENVQSEDCLYLNIWVPAGRDGERPEGGWPVQFFIRSFSSSSFFCCWHILFLAVWCLQHGTRALLSAMLLLAIFPDLSDLEMKNSMISIMSS
jgi:Carboxylesterase family